MPVVTPSSQTGDCIGMESFDDPSFNEDNSGGVDKNRALIENQRRGKRDHLWDTKQRREFPPPMPSLARTENLSSHMPWIMKRYHTADGRLIIREEKVRHHEYFRVHRSNGRLTLQLVHLGDNYDDVLSPRMAALHVGKQDLDGSSAGHESLGGDHGSYGGVKEGSCDDDACRVGSKGMIASTDLTAVEEPPMMQDASLPEPSGAGTSCNYGYNGMASGSSIFGMPVFAVRPLHS